MNSHVKCSKCTCWLHKPAFTSPSLQVETGQIYLQLMILWGNYCIRVSVLYFVVSNSSSSVKNYLIVAVAHCLISYQGCYRYIHQQLNFVFKETLLTLITNRALLLVW